MWAEKMKLPTLQHALLPRTGAFSAGMRMLHDLDKDKDKTAGANTEPTYVYDVTVGMLCAVCLSFFLLCPWILSVIPMEDQPHLSLSCCFYAF